MSELIDQIAKLEAKAHALKESVSNLYFITFIFSIQRKYLEALKKFDELLEK
jgi:predicted solute-binding protein